MIYIHIYIYIYISIYPMLGADFRFWLAKYP